MKELYNLLQEGKQVHCAVGDFPAGDKYVCRIFWLKNGINSQGTLIAQAEECDMQAARKSAYATFFNMLNAYTKDRYGHTKLYHLYKDNQLPDFCLYYVKMFKDDLKIAPFADYRAVFTLLELMGYHLQTVEMTNRFVIQKKSSYAGARLGFDAFD